MSTKTLRLKKLISKSQLNVRLHPDLYEEVEQYAYKYGITKTDMIHLALRNYFKIIKTRDNGS